MFTILCGNNTSKHPLCVEAIWESYAANSPNGEADTRLRQGAGKCALRQRWQGVLGRWKHGRDGILY